MFLKKGILLTPCEELLNVCDGADVSPIYPQSASPAIELLYLLREV
jgi:hypothetical protein